MKMLLVDDDAVSRAAMIGMAGPPPGWEVIEAEDGQQALELARKGLKPDLCVVDLLMPNMDGTEFLQHVRKDPYLQHLKVVATSSRRDRDTILALAKLQVSGYLLKPYDPAATRATLLPLMNAPATRSRKTARFTLLAVDDDPVIREALNLMLTSMADWSVEFAVDGNDAFECLYAGLRPDLILTDLSMANADGIELLKRLRRDRNFAGIKLAVLTGDTDRDDSSALASFDLCAFIRKPIRANQLTQLLGRISNQG